MDWQVSVRDGNGLADLQELRIELGGDVNLGIAGTSSLNNARIWTGEPASSPVQSVTGEVMTFDLALAPEWSLTPSTLTEGAVRVVATDVDGSNASTVNGAWAFARELTFDNVVFADPKSTQGPVNADSILAVGEQLNLSATINHSASGVPYDGGLRIRWFGNVGPERWDGEAPSSCTTACRDGRANPAERREADDRPPRSVGPPRHRAAPQHPTRPDGRG